MTEVESTGSHVHFQEVDDGFSHESKIIIEQRKRNYLVIHLGFLSLNHRYQINFIIPGDKINLCSKDLIFMKHNPSICISDFHSKEISNGIEVKLNFFAQKAKLLKESLKFSSEDENLELIFQARVLGKGQGTPSLREGIHVIQVIDDEESDQSDWQGF